MNPCNKGERVTRTAVEARSLADHIRMMHSDWTEETFRTAARQFSECSTSKNGGELGWISKGDFAEDFEEHTLKLREQEVSAPFETALGFHVVFRGTPPAATPRDGV
jgi:hypothetical protein